MMSSRAFRRERGGELSRPGQPLPSWRADYDRTVADAIDQYACDAGVLAGYMLIFTPEMARRHPFLNLHPAAPDGPVGTWQEVIRQLIESGAEESGVMIHLATEELDRGPVMSFCKYSLTGAPFDPLRAADATAAIEDSALFSTIRKHGAAREVPLVVETLRALASGRITLGRPAALDLTAEVDAAVALTTGIS
jgi:folate-dependent phosphoribosylglycinamide formyltransferase PurN